MAIGTPMNEDGSVNYEKFGELIEFQIANGTDAIIVCGTTGESSTLTHEEHLDTIKYCVDKVAKRIPVVAGTGSNCTETAVYLSQEAEKYGVDGILLVDLPPEEADEPRAAFAAAGLALILLASPTSSDARLDSLCQAAQGYLYYVSFAGVTGASERLDSTAASERLRLLRSRSSAPVVAGFGIKDAASAAAMAVDADGVVVGSALVAAMDGSADAGEAAMRASTFLHPLRAALDTLAVVAA